MAQKVYTLSDLHIDYKNNFNHLLALTDSNYSDAALIVPGDVTDNIDKLGILLRHFKQLFAEVFFVPGNHELWIRGNNNKDSIAKFQAIMQMCRDIGVHTQPFKLGSPQSGVWIVPLFSWYSKAGEGKDSLYQAKPGNDQTENIWNDNYLCHWDSLPAGQRVVDYFLSLNEANVVRQYDAPVISFSHFLPLSSLIYPLNNKWQKNFVDPLPQFNFSRVAGTTLLAEQIKTLNSVIHVYGHQHRNRHRSIEGTTYISHCLAYPKERARAGWRGNDRPKLIWHDGAVAVDNEF